MTAKEVAAELLRHPEAEVLQLVGSDWVEVVGVEATGSHRNAVCLRVVEDMGGVPGVIIHKEDS